MQIQLNKLHFQVFKTDSFPAKVISVQEVSDFVAKMHSVWYATRCLRRVDNA